MKAEFFVYLDNMKIKIAIVDSRISEAQERRLTLAGFRVITLPPFSKLSAPVASHTDMLIHRIGNEYISFADYCEEASYVFSDISLYLVPLGARMTFTADEVSSEYPCDARLNALHMDNKLFCKADSISPRLLEAARERGVEVISTKQGYPACTVLKLSEHAAITADRGMADVLTRHGINVTLIENGDIALEPYEYGFIGGAGGVYDGVLYLFGDPKTHRSYEKIKAAADTAGLSILPLSGGPLCDLGGILFAEGYIDEHGQ